MTAAVATVNIENIEPFARVRKEVGALYDSFVEKTNVHFDWLNEILEEAKQAFQKPEVELLPKTPSEKRKRGRAKRGSVQKRESSAKKRQASTGRPSRKSTAYLKVKAAILDFGKDDGADSEANQSSVSEANNLENIEIPVPVIPAAIVEDTAGEEEHADGAEHTEIDGHGEAADQMDNIEPENVVHVVVENVDAKEPDQAEVAEESQPVNGLVVVEENRILRTPEPMPRKAAPSTSQKSLLPIPVSGTKEKLSTPSVLTPRIAQGNPINRYTPQKSAAKAPSAEARDRLNQQMAEATAKRNELLKLKVEEQKRIREERALKVAKQRMLQKAKDEELKRKIEEKYTPSITDLEEKRKLRPRYPDSASKKADNDRVVMVEKEKAKEKERIQREQEEMQRLKAVEHERKLQAAAPAVVQPKQAEVKETSHPATQPKNQSVFHQPEDKSVAKVAVGTGKVSRETFVVASSAGASANTSGATESYDMTPLRKTKPATANNYDISDLRSSDETDDEEHPRKKIPAWAQGGQLKMALTQQYYNSPDLDDLFGVVQMPDLAQMFTFQRKRFFKRTSSAKWDSPIHPHAHK